MLCTYIGICIFPSEKGKLCMTGVSKVPLFCQPWFCKTHSPIVLSIFIDTPTTFSRAGKIARLISTIICQKYYFSWHLLEILWMKSENSIRIYFCHLWCKTKCNIGVQYLFILYSTLVWVESTMPMIRRCKELSGWAL